LSLYDWRDPQNDNLWQGETGINNPCPAGWRLPTSSELETERLSWSTDNKYGSYASALKWPVAGYRAYWPVGTINNADSYAYIWSSSISTTNSFWVEVFSSNTRLRNNSFRAYGASVRCVRDDSHVVLNYSTTTGGAISGDTDQVLASGGNGTAVQAVPDSGYLFTQWSDSSTQNPRTDIAVTSDLDVVAEFVVSPCGTMDNIIFTYNGASVTYGVVANITTNECWLDRNLGASQVATESGDTLGYGDLFQWGRGDDGHQIRTSGTTATLSSSDSSGHSNFITSSSAPLDWRSPQNNNLWQGVSGTNNPCPSFWRIPTETELNNERLSWETNDPSGAFSSPLKLPTAKSRNEDGGSGYPNGRYWSSIISGGYSRYLAFTGGGSAGLSTNPRVFGYSIRCIYDN